MPAWVANIAELAVFYAAGVLALAGAIYMAGRYMDRHSHISQERVRAVGEYTRDFRIYVPPEWDRERTR